MTLERDDNLRRFATDRQWEILEAFWEHGSQDAAARALGLVQSTVSESLSKVKSKAARQGYAPEYDHTHEVPDGFKVKGVSTYYGRDGEPRGQWVKTQEDRERQLEIMREAIQALAEDLPKMEPAPAPEFTEGDYLAAYPISDHHNGMYSWDKETGADYDLVIAEKLLTGAFSHLTGAMPPARCCLIPVLGDYFHYDGLEPVTPTGKNQLDSDGRYAKMVRVGIRSLRRAVDIARRKHAEVRIIIEPGNHDLSGSVFLVECLNVLYENEPRVTVDTSPRHFHYHQFGSNLIGVHHGHGVRRLEDLALIMATDMPDAWGKTRHRYWWTGHIHKDTVKDVQGVHVESFQILAPTDAWAANKGYRGGRSMKAILLHKDHGEVQRVAVNPEMIL